MTPAGETVFAVSGSAAGKLGIITVAPGASTWAPPVALGSGDGTDVQLYGAADGRIAAIWTNWSDEDPSVFVSLRPAGGAFQAPVAVTRDPAAAWPAVAIHGDRLAAAWLSDDPHIRGVAQTLP